MQRAPKLKTVWGVRDCSSKAESGAAYIYSVEYNIEKKRKKKKGFLLLAFLFLFFIIIIVKREVGGTQARPSPPPPSITPQPANGSPPGRFAASLRLKGGPRDIVVV